MRVLVCGSRVWTNRDVIMSRLSRFSTDTVVVHGAARGADTIAGEVAEHLLMKVEKYPADWNQYGKSAGPIRNRQMLDTKPDLVVAFSQDIANSRGTRDCVKEAQRRGIRTEVISG